jgi:hypothetical protein
VPLNGVPGYTCELCHGTGIARKQPSQGVDASPTYNLPPDLWNGFEDPPLMDKDRAAGLGHIREALAVLEQADVPIQGRLPS